MQTINDKFKHAYTYIKNKILEGELPPRTDLSETQLQAELGISRTPVREAIIKLREDGLVQIYPRKGTFVTEITLDIIRWTYEARKLVEPSIVKNACGVISIEWLNTIKSSFEKYVPNGMLEPEFRRYYIDLDRELHNTILQTCRNDFVRNMMERVYDHSHRIRVRTSTINRFYDSSVSEHLEIIYALLSGDADIAEAAAYKHIQNAMTEAFRYTV